MSSQVCIEGVEFVREQQGMYVRLAPDSEENVDVMLICMGEHDWEVWVHISSTGEVVTSHKTSTKEFAVLWAKSKGYLE